MRVVSWNVNGLRAVLKNRETSLRQFLDSFSADIICLQEVKGTRAQLGHDVAICEGYSAFFSFCRVKQGYSGVVTFCSTSCTPVAAEEGLTGISLTDHQQGREDSVGCPADLPDLSTQEVSSLDSEGRAVVTEHHCDGGRRVVVVNVYCPRVDPESPERLPFKLNFYTALRERCRALTAAGREVIVAGDFNCVLVKADSAVLEEMPTFPRESETRTLLKEFVGSAVDAVSPPPLLIDSFRHLYPDRRSAFSCWCTKTDSRKLNYGQRIDFILLTAGLLSLLRESAVLQDEHGSDHCPVAAELDLSPLPALAPPSLSSSYFSEFAGRQSKLSAFFSRGSGVSSTVNPSTALKRSSSGSSSTSSKRPKMATLLSFLQSNPGHTQEPSPVVLPAETAVLPPSSTTKLATEWQGVFRGPSKAPNCPGHGEPAVERVVKKPGPNKGRRFYVCARPEGAKSDPASRCDFFKWASGK